MRDGLTAAHPLTAVLPVFLVTRAAIFFAATAATDSIVYRQYGVAARVAPVVALFRNPDHTVEHPQLAGRRRDDRPRADGAVVTTALFIRLWNFPPASPVQG